MKNLLYLTFVYGSILIYPLGILNAQFYTDFSASEGLSDGLLNASDNWSVWDGQMGDTTFTVDTSDTGVLIIDPTMSGWQSAKYIGTGGTLDSDSYYGEVRFMLNYTVGASSLLAGSSATVMPALTIRGTDNGQEQIVFGMRQHAPSAQDDPNNGNIFNFFTLNTLNPGVWDGDFSLNSFVGTEIGLAVDENGNWTDGQSDELLLTFSAVYLGKDTESGLDSWELTSSLINVSTSTLFETISRQVIDSDDSFAAQSSHYFEMNDDNMDAMQGAVLMDSLTLALEPNTWAGYEIDAQGWVDTMNWMGWLNVANDPWIWSDDMQSYIYSPEEDVMQSGAWIYLPGN